MSSNFRYQPFVTVSGNLGAKVPAVEDVLSSHEQEFYPTTFPDENCIEFEFRTDRNYYVDLRQTYLALKLKHVRGRGYETYNTKEVKKEHIEEAKAEEEETVEEEAVPLVTHVNNILHSNFSNVEVYINNQQIYHSNGLYAHKSYTSNNFKWPSLNTREFGTARDTKMKVFLMKLWKCLCLDLFSQGDCKGLANPMASCCMVIWGLTLSPLLNCYIQIWKSGYD